jgi:hypothetical protein
MKTNNKYKITGLKSSYGDIKPDGWAVTRMRARLAREANDNSALAPHLVYTIFRRYVLGAMITIFALTAWLGRPADTATYATSPQEIEQWLLGDATDEQAHDVPEFTFLMDF